MNKQGVLFHLREAKEELANTIARIESEPEFGDIEFAIGLAHLYSHVNTAWNSRNIDEERAAAHSEDDFYLWGAFPSDISRAK